METSASTASEWMTINALSGALPTSRDNLNRWKEHPDFPKPKIAKGCKTYLKTEVEKFAKAHTKWAKAGLSTDAQSMKDEMIALDLEAKREAAAVRRGELVNKKSVADAIISLGSELFAMMKDKFVDELPSKYAGKNEVECRFLNETAFNEIAVAFRAGSKRVEGQ